MGNKRTLRRQTALLMGLATALILTMFASCERRPLEVLADEGVQVKIVNDWDNHNFIYGKEPNGMTVMLWGENTHTTRIESRNDTAIVFNDLKPDRYHLIIFNETFSDFGYQYFAEAGSYENMVMRSNHYTTRGWDSDVDYMHYPDPISVSLDTFDITNDMTTRDTTIFVFYDDYRKNGSAAYEGKVRTYRIPELAWPMTVNLYIKAKVKRRQAIKRNGIEANISGMADGFYFSQIRRTTETGTLRLTDWTLEAIGDPADSMGLITAHIPSFGLPYGKELLSQRDSTDNILNFYITLVNDSVQRCSFKVAKDMRYITPEGREAQIRYRTDLQNIRLEIDLSDIIVMPPIPIPQGGAGFNAKVDEWEDGGTFEFGGF